MTQVMSDDLGHSGVFRPIDPASFVPNSMANGVPVWANWSILGAQALITGDIADQGGGQLRVEFRLWSITQQKQVQGTAYTTTHANWRRISHIIGDVVYEQMIGEKGYFDSRVAYISEAGPVTSPVRRLAVMDYDGANNQFLTDGSSMALSPQFNPTRQQLAFVSFQNNSPRVYLFDLQSGRQQLVGSFGDLTIGPKFSPDGNTLLMSVSRGGGAAIVQVSPGGGGMTELTDSNSINVTPSFSPDGSQIVFNSDRDGNQQLFVMGAGGGSPKRISFGDGQYAEPAWSPRGDLIAFTRWGSGGFFRRRDAAGRLRRAHSEHRLSGGRVELLPEREGDHVLPADAEFLRARLPAGDDRHRRFQRADHRHADQRLRPVLVAAAGLTPDQSA